MAGLSVTVSGAKELRRNLNALEEATKKAGRGELKSVFMSAARVVEVAAMGEVPVRSGKLRKSIRAQATVRGAKIVAGGPGVPYAMPIHWGWPSRPNKARKIRGGPIKANKFLMRARDENVDVVAGMVADGLDDLIRKYEL